MQEKNKITSKEKKTCRTDEEKKYLTTRLNTIEGQIRGIKGMINDDRYCDDILVQISAVANSLKSLGRRVLKDHLTNCLSEDIKNNSEEAINELIELFQKIK